MTSTAILFALSLALVGAYRSLAQTRGWFDLPNQRSSHTHATPRGAGIVFAVLISGAAFFELSVFAPIYRSILVGLGVAAVGWWDDIGGGLAARYRFILYWLFAFIALLSIDVNWLHGQSLLVIVASLAIASLALLWLINLYNFMDGINGIATFEAIFVLAGSLWLGAGSAYDSHLHTTIIAAICVLIGFAAWNFPTGKVFMGDVGSAFLGFFLGVLMLWSIQLQGPSLSAWLILLAVFVADTGYTLCLRVITGQQWHQPHRTHLYQILSRRLDSHTKTVLLLMGVNVFWLLPLAWALHRHWLSAPIALPAAYAPLLFAGYKLGAGIPAKSGV